MNGLNPGTVHPDDMAVDQFAAAMKAKLAQSRAKGRSGWNDKNRCTQLRLSHLLAQHVLKGDPIDVANFAMMLCLRGEQISPGVEVWLPHELQVIGDLIELARTVNNALDDSEEMDGPDGRQHAVAGQHFDDVCEALTRLENLPDDQPGMTLGPAGKAIWALRRILWEGFPA